jgi:hypothetical protein
MVRRHLCHRPCSLLLILMKVGKLLGRVNVVCDVIRRWQVKGHTPLITSSPWRQVSQLSIFLT